MWKSLTATAICAPTASASTRTPASRSARPPPALRRAQRRDLQAARGTYNLAPAPAASTTSPAPSASTATRGLPTAASRYENTNPFLFSGRIVVKTGPEDYDIYDGNVTSCLLPNPDWLLSGSISRSTATRPGPQIHLPPSQRPHPLPPLRHAPHRRRAAPVRHPHPRRLTAPPRAPSSAKRSTSSSAVPPTSPSACSTSPPAASPSPAPSATAASATTSSPPTPPPSRTAASHSTAPTPLLTDQGGQDVTLAFRHKFTSKTRVVGDAEYLSSYVYREAFNESFNQAVSSDITSVAYIDQPAATASPPPSAPTATRASSAFPSAPSRPAGAHLPRALARLHRRRPPHRSTPLLWSLQLRRRPQALAAQLRLLRHHRALRHPPGLDLPLHFAGVELPEAPPARETFYSRSRQRPRPGRPP